MKKGLDILRQVLRGILIAVLIAAAVTAVLYAFRKQPDRRGIAETRNDLNGIAQAIEAFETEYEKLPHTPSSDFELEGLQTKDLITMLLGKEDPASSMQNPRQIAFLVLRISKNKKRGGLVFSYDKKPKGIYDTWGNPLRVILRLNGQSTLTLTHAGKQVTTSKRVVVMSRGPDGEWFTKDDLISETE